MLTGSDRILQLHPTRRCNLRCLHCYSDSSPEAMDTLRLEVVLDAITDAAGLGYNVLSVSGGEPMLYAPLRQTLVAARELGLRTQIVSNGLALSERSLQMLRESGLGLLALSVDGSPGDHDRMRNKAGAFDALVRKVELVRASGLAFGLLFTLSMYNVHELEWAARLAVDSGARLLQVHPLEPTGRATALADEAPDEAEGEVALVEAARLQQQYAGRLAIQVDIATTDQLCAALESPPEPSRIVDVVSPIVIEPDGMCVPLEYGFDRSFALGDITSGRLSAYAAAWMRDVYPAFRAGSLSAIAALRAQPSRVVMNSYSPSSKAGGW